MLGRISCPLALALASLATGAGAAGATTTGCARATAVADDARALRHARDAVLCLVNRERARRGRPRLRASRALARAAGAHSREMASRGYAGHVSPSGAGAAARARRAGYGRARLVGETIAWGARRRGSPAALVRALMRSPAHRRLLLDRRFREIGVGLSARTPRAGPGATLTIALGRP